MSLSKNGFTDREIENLFGAEDAEGERKERFKEYFVANKSYEKLTEDLPIRILVGHKGVGKSALLRRAYLDDEESGRLAVFIQPGDIEEIAHEIKSQDFNRLIEGWKRGIVRVIAKKAAERLGASSIEKTMSGWAANLTKGLSATIFDFLSLIKPEIAGQVEKSLFDRFSKTMNIFVYIDDIDRGWKASNSDINSISALLNAIRDLGNADENMRCRIALRTDVYYLVRTSDESTDKIERNIIQLTWTNHEILCLAAYRISRSFGKLDTYQQIKSMSQSSISRDILSLVIEEKFTGEGHWSKAPIHRVLLSLCRARPRDLIKMFHGAAKAAYLRGHKIITTHDLESSFPRYSEERLQDLVNEFKSELPQIQNVLLQFRPAKRQRRTSDSFLFSRDQIIVKIKNIKQHVSASFTSGKPSSDIELLTFLYKIDFLQARAEEEDGSIVRRNFDQSRFLINPTIDFGFDMEVHPAYRWALQPTDIQGVIDSWIN
ncbi:hypothetical protein HL653_13890 [Sphingomonas sp. AP4-R1]|uniref:P-loop ATPase, Sll1717 family n=1 Tax=Sphingomonas sp. AP4-R1 TaxID=2735134 RepID=UPI001493662B|nr:hypothetical protein [Sphingomonas sp. AP4-R1]QJU58713.1 hypothetical protein HL653_13890 [Sphingomonas sp. AP4-R1]